MHWRDRIARRLIFLAMIIATDRYVGRLIHAIRTTPMDQNIKDLIDRSLRPE